MPQPVPTQAEFDALDQRVQTLTSQVAGLTTAQASLEARVSALEPQPVDCVLAEWSDWSEWSAWSDNGNGTESRTRTRTRGVVTAPAHGGLACGPLSDTDTETRDIVIVPPPSPPAGSHPYYDKLAVHPKAIHRFPCRSAEEIAGYRHNAPNGEFRVVYDPVREAALSRMHPAVNGQNEPGGLEFPEVLAPGSTFLHTWDTRWDAGWRYVGAGYVPHYKTWAFTKAGEPPWMLVKTEWDAGAAAGRLALLKVTFPNNAYYVPGQSWAGAGEKIEPSVGTFYLDVDRTVRQWLYVTAVVGGVPNEVEMSYWAADAVQGVVQIYDRVRVLFPAGGIEKFRLLYDTSYDHVVALNPEAKSWNDGIVVLQDVTLAEVTALLEAPPV